MSEALPLLAPELRPHRRYNPLTGEWVLVSPQRAQRPWQGAQEKLAPSDRLPYDPQCYLCPGNTRAVGVTNPRYTGTYVFDNDFPALLPPAAPGEPIVDTAHPLLRREDESGVCRVICFSPRHDLTLPDMDLPAVRGVVDVWAAQCQELGARDDIGYVQVFENKGEVMGCSNPHPHSQLWATRHLPTYLANEQRHQAEYLMHHDRPLLVEYADVERASGERILHENAHFLVLVPFWAVWPFETMILPKSHVRRLTDLTDAARTDLADAIQNLTRRYDNLFEVAFPYSMGIHQAAFDSNDHDEWQMHLHFYPPLLRSATVKKFLVGYEMLAQSQRDLTAEQAADRLRKLPATPLRGE